jgi:hypothetical protein
MSYWLDWWMLIGIGVIIVLITRLLPKIGIKLSPDSYLPKYLFVLTILLFYIFSGSLFAGFSEDGSNPLGLGTVNDFFFGFIKTYLYPNYYAAHPNATSTEFMYSSGEQWLKDAGAAPFDDLEGLAHHPFHLFVGVFLFMLYPYFLRAGMRLGEILFGSKPGKKGIIHLL